MADQFDRIEPRHRAFIERQHMFFTASAAPQGHINLSPKGLEALRVLDPNAVVYLDHTGSGNETAGHIHVDGRLTIMFCAFEGPPMILRLYGKGRVLPKGGSEYSGLLMSVFGGEEPLGARQMIRLDVELVITSCGFAVPHYEYVAQRRSLMNWAESQGRDKLQEYRRSKNEVTLDGFPTGFRERVTPENA
jgi:hypothetical protein